MSEKQIIHNRFDPRTTKTVIVHDGRFHADDMLFVAMANIAAKKYKNSITVVRTSQLPTEYDKTTIVGDIGFGVYDHHQNIDGTDAIGTQEHSQGERMAASCGILYHEIKDLLFPGDSETKKVFEAFIDIIEHCDNTPDNNTFSDSINLLTPIDENEMEAATQKAALYCETVVNGFISAHEKECSGKTWAIPRVCSGIVPGVVEKRDARYWKASNQLKNKYKYVSFNNKLNMKLRSMDTYSLACGVLNQRTRQYWRDEIERNDLVQINEMERREKEDWPVAVKAMKNRTIEMDNYIPYGPYVKEIPALFVVLPSQRGGYTITILKTNTGKYRFDPSLLLQFEGCTFAANDKRFVFFDSKEKALAAAHTAGQTVDKYIEKYGFDAYRDIYGGCAYEYTGDFYQDLIAEDISLNMFVREFVKNPNNLTVAEYRAIQTAVVGNPYLVHAFCTHFNNDGDAMSWDFEKSVTEISGLTQDTLLTKLQNGRPWDAGFASYITSEAGDAMMRKIKPQKLPPK